MNKKIIIIIITAVLVVGIYFFNNNTNEEYEEIYTEENIVQENKQSMIKVHIIGEVVNPGIYEIEEGSRIDDVIKIAGGITQNADLNKVNLAYEVSDGEKVSILSIFDEEMEYNVSSGKVNINKASAEELQKISGVGASLANRIIEYRKENGKFSSIEDLKNVSGIGDKKFESIKEHIVVK